MRLKEPTDLMNVVFDHAYSYKFIHNGDDHSRKNWKRIAAQALAEKILENGHMLKHETYMIDRMAYHTVYTIMVGRPERKPLP